MYMCFECGAGTPDTHKGWCRYHPDRIKADDERYWRNKNACHCAHLHEAGRVVPV